ncbi:MAG TPA: acyl-CoA synthetase [Rhizomicrobium sp.]|jgi:acyl-CoA synthetase (AMP-forming)/AMP-acid ligase II|nr:acyl-CoA synthetase [Rhizomicrobium sp.]
MPWNFGDILDAIAPVVPQDAPAFVHGTRRISWGETTKRSNNLARALIRRGAKPRAKVAFYMRNRPEYCETLAACFKARLTHVNVNYRYKPEEVFYIFDNSDAQTVVYGSEFRDVIAQIRPRLGKVQTFVEVTDDGKPADFALDFELLATEGDGAPVKIERSPQDEFFIYTGGTTGMPKGVIWTHDDLRETSLIALRKLGPVPENLEQVVAAIRLAGPGGRLLPACPLMHGTGLLMAVSNMMAGGCVITLQHPSFSAHEMWKAVEDNKAMTLVIVGDAFAKPMLAALEEEPGRYDTTSIVNMISSGVMWSREVKQGLLRHIPQAILVDSFGSSEAVGFGTSMMTKDGEIQTAKFTIGDRCKVFDENDRMVAPGSGTPGIIAMPQPIPLGYYKDAKKTAETFKTIDGVRYSMPGDWCVVEADGTLTLLGRGSACINTAGEKVYPEEVEETLKLHPSVEDALVVGVPDDKWGQSITAVIVPSGVFDEEDVRAHVRQRLAGYKTPKRVLVAGVALRAPNGKADYKSALDFAKRELGIA